MYQMSTIQAARNASRSAVRNCLSDQGTEGSFKVAKLHAELYAAGVTCTRSGSRSI